MSVQQIAANIEKAVAEHLKLYCDKKGNLTDESGCQYLGSTRTIMDVAPDELRTEDFINFSEALKIAFIPENFDVNLVEYANRKYHVEIWQTYDTNGNYLGHK